MDKKQKISWGVSFGSLALVAGMVSYLGLSTEDKTDNKMAYSQDQVPGQSSDNSWGGDSPSPFNQNDPSVDNNYDNGEQSFGGSNQQPDQFSNGGGQSSGHHHGFDTTTGGT